MLTDLSHDHRDEAIVDVHVTSDLHHLGDVLVIDEERLRITLLIESFVGGQFNHVTRFQYHFCTGTLQK